MDMTERKRFLDRINELEAELAERDMEISALEDDNATLLSELQVAKAQLAIVAREQKYALIA
jgi:hypothetical protein